MYHVVTPDLQSGMLDVIPANALKFLYVYFFTYCIFPFSRSSISDFSILMQNTTFKTPVSPSEIILDSTLKE